MTQKVVQDLQTVADTILHQHFDSAGVMVDNKGNIIYITGHLGKYLEPVSGKGSWNIHAMAREGLRQKLPGAFRKVMKSVKPVVLPNLIVGTNGRTISVNITLKRIEDPDIAKEMIMVIFTDVSAT